MTKLFGALVGTPKQTPGYAGIPNYLENGKEQILQRDYVTTAGNLINDTVSLGVFPSNTVFSEASEIDFDAFGAGCTLSLGDATHPTALLNALDVHAAGSSQPWKLLAKTAWWQPLWQQLGYAADPKGTIELIATFAGANPANANLAWSLKGNTRNG